MIGAIRNTIVIKCFSIFPFQSITDEPGDWQRSVCSYIYAVGVCGGETTEPIRCKKFQPECAFQSESAGSIAAATSSSPTATAAATSFPAASSATSSTTAAAATAAALAAAEIFSAESSISSIADKSSPNAASAAGSV